MSSGEAVSVAQGIRFASSGRGTGIRAAASLRSASGDGQPQNPLPASRTVQAVAENRNSNHGCEEQRDYILSVAYNRKAWVLSVKLFVLLFDMTFFFLHLASSGLARKKILL